MRLLFLLEKELRLFRRNPFLPQMILVYPLMIMLVFPWAVDLAIKNIQLCVVDLGNTPSSREFIDEATASGYFTVTSFAGTYPEALQELEKGNCDMILELPIDFEKQLYRAEPSEVLVAVNSVDGTKGALGSAYMTEIIARYNQSFIAQNNLNSIKPPAVRIARLDKYNPNLDYKNYMIPSMMSIIITLICGFLPALNIVTEKERGTMEQMNVCPITKFEFMLSKLLPYWIVGLVLITFCVFLAWLIYDLYPASNLFVFYLYVMIYIEIISAFGLVISNYSQTLQQAMFVMFFFLIVFILMGGQFTPIASMPSWAQYITYLNPLRYIVAIMRSLYLRGSSFTEMLSQAWPLFVFAGVFTTWAIKSYKR